MKLSQNFFQRNAKIVAIDLIGKILVRKVNGKELKGRIVETEAYFGEEDPASRACKGGELRETMKKEGGTILVYGVHNNWLINFVTGEKNNAEAVLLRALEPLNFDNRCCGPGLLTGSLSINKDFHRKNIFNCGEIWIENTKQKLQIVERNRIGVTEDLKEPLRFYMKDNKHVSRK